MKESLANWTHIPSQDQVFLTNDGIELDSRHNLNQYHAQLSGSESAGALVYVFNRADGSQRRSIVPPAIPSFEPRLLSHEDVRLSCPPRASIQSDTVTTRMLPQFEQAFKKRVLDADAYLTCFGELMRYANNARAEQDAVLAALEAALNNLDRHAKHMRRTTDSFHTQYASTKLEHHTLLESWPRALERLKEIEVTGKMRRYVGSASSSSPNLDPTTTLSNSPAASPLALQPIASPSAASSSSSSAASPAAGSTAQTSSRITLYDVLSPSLPRYQRDQEQCVREHAILDKKVEEMMTKYRKVDTRVVDALQAARNDVKSCSKVLELRESMREAASAIEEFTRRRETLSSEYSRVFQYIEKIEEHLTKRAATSSSSTSGGGAAPSESYLVSLDPPLKDALSTYSQLDELQTAQLREFEQRQEWMRKVLLPLVSESTTAVQTLFLDVQARIFSVSPALSNLLHVVPLNQGALDRLTNLVKSSIQPLHSLPSAWSSVLQELPRRRTFRRLFHQEASSMAQRLHRLAGEETQRRDKWQKEYGSALPKGTVVPPSIPGARPSWQGGFGPLISQLNERPPMLDLSFADFDANLPDLLDGVGMGSSSTGGGSSSNSNLPSLPRSASGHTLPVIDESAAGGLDLNDGASSAAATTTAASLASAQAIQAQFPWMQALAEAAEKIAALEKENLSFKYATSLIPNTQNAGTPKSHSRKNSTSSSAAAASSTPSSDPSSASPTQSSRSTSSSSAAEWKAKYEAKLAEYNEVHANAVALEQQLVEAKEVQSKYDKLLVKTTEKNDLVKKLESELAKKSQEYNQMSVQSALNHQRLTTRMKELEAQHARELEQLKSAHQFEKELVEATQQGSARKLAFSNFAVPDLVLFVKNPKRKDAIDQLEVLSTNGEHWFISPESAQQYKQKLKRKQEREDELLAKQAGAPASAAAAVASSSSSSSAAAAAVAGPALNFGEFIGEIVEINQYKAEANQNPFQLPVGTTYSTVTVVIPDDEQ